MPVQKEKKYEISFKNLRHREIPCLVIAVPQKSKHSSNSVESGTKKKEEKSRTKLLKRLKQRLNRLPTSHNKKSKSLSSLDGKSLVSSKVSKKRVYRRRNLHSDYLPIKQSKNDELNLTTKVTKRTPEAMKTTPEVMKTTPEVMKRNPEVMNTTPEVMKTTPEIMKATPEVTKTTPETKKTSPFAKEKTPKKRTYRKKNLDPDYSPIKQSKNDELNLTPKVTKRTPEAMKTTPEVMKTTPEVIKTTPEVMKTMPEIMKATPEVTKTTPETKKTSPFAKEKTPKKRTYRKKIILCHLQVPVGARITPITASPVSSSMADSCFGAPVITPDTPKKRIYRKKLKIPAVPHNTPVLCQTAGGDPGTGASFLSLCDVSRSLGQPEVITVGKRGRGRPRTTVSLPARPPAPAPSETGDESTMSLGSDKGSTTKRVRRSLWAFDSEDEDDADNQVSEYELLRQKNIEENLKKLREIFSEQGLQFEEKTSDTPKKRKNYSRVPLPPPRPKSQRIEIRHQLMPLDFSKLDEKLTMSEAAFI